MPFKASQLGPLASSVIPLHFLVALSIAISASCFMLSGSVASLTLPVLFPAVRLDFDRANHTQKILDAITRIAYTISIAVTLFIAPFPT